MHLKKEYLEEPSVHYYTPLPTTLQDILYYPVSVGYFECKPEYRVQRNTFKSYLVLVMLSGSLAYQTRSGRGTARAGQVLLLDCSVPHSYSAQGRCSFTFVHFDGGQAQAICAEIERSCGNLMRVPDPNRLHESIGEIMDMMRRERRVNEAQASSILYDILMQLLQASGASGEGNIGNTMVDRAITYIQEHLGEKLTVEAIAANSGYSPSYFSHVFTQETGMSPYQFVVKTRVEFAQQLLRTTKLPIQDVAFQAGFNSVANFCYGFRKEVGVSPHEYRNQPV